MVFLICLRKIIYQSITYRLLVTKQFDSYYSLQYLHKFCSRFILRSWKIFRDERQSVHALLIAIAHIAYSHQSPHTASLHHHKSHLRILQKYCYTSCMENGIKLFSVPSTFNLIFCFAMLLISPYLLFL